MRDLLVAREPCGVLEWSDFVVQGVLIVANEAYFRFADREVGDATEGSEAVAYAPGHRAKSLRCPWQASRGHRRPQAGRYGRTAVVPSGAPTRRCP